MALLEKGDIVLIFYQKKFAGRLVIERVTKTKAISGNYEFHRKYTNNKIRRKQRSKYSFETFHLGNDEKIF